MQRWVKNTLISEIYFDDLQIVWDYWGNHQFLEAGELKQILNNDGKPKNTKGSRGDDDSRQDYKSR